MQNFKVLVSCFAIEGINEVVVVTSKELMGDIVSDKRLIIEVPQHGLVRRYLHRSKVVRTFPLSKYLEMTTFALTGTNKLRFEI
ncbi:MAG: hypothetical protein VX513_06520 [Pseudomonadota bacterium]|nr:hypothetical protein [Pseudomonadota bacterium]